MPPIRRRDLLHTGTAALAGLLLDPSHLSAVVSAAPDDALLLHEVTLLREMDAATNRSLWNNLAGITAAELDWRPHPQANTARWIVGHLTWFDEWASDAIEEIGMYLDDKQGPDSFQDPSFDVMRARYEAARERYVGLLADLTPPDLRREVRFVYNQEHDVRWTMDMRRLLQIYTTHLAGHRYQIRYIRGTYSRAHDTDKAAFDPW